MTMRSLTWRGLKELSSTVLETIHHNSTVTEYTMTPQLHCRLKNKETGILSCCHCLEPIEVGQRVVSRRSNKVYPHHKTCAEVARLV